MPNLSGSLLIEPAEIGGASISETAPASPNAGQLWFESDTAQTYVYYDSQWIEIGAAPGLAGVSDSAPSSPAIGQFWFDSTSGATNVYYDSQWIEIGASAQSVVTVSDTAPASPALGAIWFNSSDGGTYVYYSSVWAEIGAVPADTSNSVIDAKGDLLVGTTADTLARLAVGTASQVLTVDASTATGLTWTTPASAGAPINSPTFTGNVVLPNTTTIGDISSTELSYLNNVSSAIQTQLDAKQAVVANVSDTEISYLNGVTSAIQTQIDTKQAIVANVSNTEIGYLDGVTSAIQTQLDAKATTGKAIAMAIVFG